MKLIRIAFVACLVAACSQEAVVSPPEPGTVRVERVVDGDTVVLEGGERLRYVGIDTPEKLDRRKPVQCFAAEATDANRRLVEGKTVVVEIDVEGRDRYGRRLGYVWLLDGPGGSRGTLVNEKLVRDGYAFAYRYPPNVAKAERIEAAEAHARQYGLGLWSGCRVHRTKGGRQQTERAGTR